MSFLYANGFLKICLLRGLYWWVLLQVKLETLNRRIKCQAQKIGDGMVVDHFPEYMDLDLFCVVSLYEVQREWNISFSGDGMDCGRLSKCQRKQVYMCTIIGETMVMSGAPIAGSAVDKIEQVVGYISLGYPFGLTASILFGRHHKAILKSPKPKLFVMGTKDGFTSVKQLENKLKSASGRVETHLIEGVSHFQMEGPSYDAQMVNLILGFISSL